VQQDFCDVALPTTADFALALSYETSLKSLLISSVSGRGHPLPDVALHMFCKSVKKLNVDHVT